ncbi:MAG: hypothetical protein NC340_05505 [Ruminococcus flavefaciens]|nr:hypothetical protein [Ruminococcus flavefaciens]MCM1230501.1 hypothetical protein [Ruminococcus flavefaciens]
MNPFGMLKIKPLFETFCQDHPKILMFFVAVAGAIDKDSVLEISLKTSKGQTMKTNILVNDNDVALFDEMKKMIAKGK